MVRYQYAAPPAQPPAPTVALIAGNLTSAAAGTKSIWLQYQGRGGSSLVSDRVEVTPATNQAIQITIPANALPSPNGADIRKYNILLGETTDPSTAVMVASQPGYDTDGETVLSPPFMLTLSEDEHVNVTSLIVPNAASLPIGGDRVNGMRRSIDDQAGAIFEWNAAASQWETAIPQDFTPHISDLQGPQGANRSLGAFQATNIGDVIFPDYGLSGLGVGVGFWLVNDESAAIAQDKRIALTITAPINGVDTDLTNHPGILAGLTLDFIGYINVTTGVLDTTGPGGAGTMDGVNDDPITFTGENTGLSLPKDLDPGWAYGLVVRMNTDTASLNGLIPQDTVLSFTPSFFSEAATPNPAARLTGSLILAEYQRRRIVPAAGLSAIALNGSGMMQVDQNGFSFGNVGQQTVVNLLPNALNQNVTINFAGQCLVVPTVPSYAPLRALVGTVDGQGKATDWSGPVTLSNAVYAQLEITYPTTIRADYDDPIAASPDGTFNATQIRIYARPTGGGNAIYWDRAITPDVASEVFTLGALTGTDSGGTEPPAAPNSRFGLYESAAADATITTPAGSSTFTSEDYEFCWAYIYSNTVTSLDHRTSSGCITEVSASFAEIFQILNYVGPPVDTLWDLRSVPFSDRASNKEFFVDEASNPYRWKQSETTTQDADLTFDDGTGPTPGTGEIRLNNADPALATLLRVSESDGTNNLATAFNTLVLGQGLRIQSKSTETTYRDYSISGAIVDNGGDRNIPVTYVGGAGSFADGDAVVLSWGDDYIRPFDVPYSTAGRFVKDDSDQILVLDAVPTSANGEVGDLAVIRNTALPEYGDVLKKDSVGGWITLFNLLPYTLTTANFNQPAVDSSVTLSVRNSRMFPIGTNVAVDGGGVYLVAAQPSATQLQITNKGAIGNAAPTTVIASGAVVAASGPGDDGGALVLDHIPTPAAPGAGKTLVYGKEDGKVYKRPAGGAEEEIGVGSGGGTVTKSTSVPNVAPTSPQAIWVVETATSTGTEVSEVYMGLYPEDSVNAGAGMTVVQAGGGTWVKIA